MNRHEYYNTTKEQGVSHQPFNFAGGLYGKDTGLVRFGARDYDPPNSKMDLRNNLIGLEAGAAGRDVCQSDLQTSP